MIDYGSGNLRSATKAFERAAYENRIDADIVLTSDPDTVAGADRIVLPGVGAFADCRGGLAAVDGMEEALFSAAGEKARPFLGICVGMQLIATRGLEKTVPAGFDGVAGDVRLMEPDDATLKIPQIGWNTLTLRHAHPLFDGIPTGTDGLHAYFVHSYYIDAVNDGDVVAETDYGGPLTAVVAHENRAGTQFHPEKSQKLGLALIANFLRWAP